MRMPVSGGAARARYVLCACVTLIVLATLAGTAQPDARQTPALSDEPFIVKPYLQLGDLPKLAPSEAVRVLWQSANDPTATWTVDVRQRDRDSWRPAIVTGGRLIAAPEMSRADVVKPQIPITTPTQTYRLFNVPLTRLEPGAEFEYQVSRNGQVVFAAKGKARASAGQPYRFVVTGDTGANTNQEKRIVHQINQARPDFFAIAGDIVYSTGRMVEYREKYFPIYNADVASPETGAPLIRSRVSFGAYGNHDAGTGDLDRDPDGLAHFLNWTLPLNGPYTQAGLPNTQVIKGPAERVKTHLALIRATFPRMANYSFDYGNSHWTVIDSNVYVDWSDAYLRNWLARDLAAARHAAWKFVVFHHPPFNSSRAHFSEQQMRLISDILEHRGVDIVFAGHVHNYQRTHPLRFLAKPAPDRTFKAGSSYMIDGDFEIDTAFDGVTDTTPDGVLYIVTGAGGAGAYDPDQTDNVPTWQPFTTKLVSDVYSFTVVDVEGLKLTLRQISETGEELDRIVVTKPARQAATTSVER
jgi:3',5'-cyclic AMP phosphodiesterase CpdA